MNIFTIVCLLIGFFNLYMINRQYKKEILAKDEFRTNVSLFEREWYVIAVLVFIQLPPLSFIVLFFILKEFKEFSKK